MMKRLTLMLALFGACFQLNAQTTHNFQGSFFNNNWNVASNWDSGMVPAATDYAEINTGVTVEITGSETIAYLKTNGSGGIHIMSGGTLTVTGTGITKPAIENSGGSGHLTNDGTLLVDGADEEGCNFKGDITNNGTMTFDNCGLHNFRVQGGDFTNAAGATLNITLDAGADQDGIAVDDNGGTGGLLTNDGDIFIIMTGGDEGIDITDGSELVNNGTIDISGGGADMGIKVRKTGSTLTNNGTLVIADTGDECIYLEDGSTVDNNGTMDMKDSAGHGIDVDEGTFNNAAGALFKAINCKDGVFIRTGGIVNNDGDMWLDLCTSEEIEIEANNGANMVNSSTATFHPGSSPGQMEIKHDVDLGASCVTFEIGGTTAEVDYDQIDNFAGTGTTALLDISGATAKLDWGTYVPEVDDCFKIVDGSGSVAGPWAVITSTNPGISYTVDYATDADTEVVICVTAVVVPVELVHFSGEKTERGSKLMWETANEINNEVFDIERSQDGQNWIKIGEVEGNGNSNVFVQYEFMDESPLDGNNYYRLKQNDFDGNFEYSGVVVVNYRVDKNEFSLYPNPVEDVLYIDMDEDAEILEVQLFDSQGKLLWSNKGAIQQIPFADYAAGVYYLNIVSPNNRTVQKITNK